MRSRTQVEDVPELMHHIQLWLPVKESARSCILSKSWLHAWSTIPTLRFHVREIKHLEVVDQTLKRYSHDNIPIERFDINIDIMNLESASLAEKWIQSVATKTCSTLKELSLSVSLTGASLTLTDEILSVSKILTKLRISSASQYRFDSVLVKTPINSNSNSIINCASLREVVLSGVHISQEVLDAIFSTCSLLEIIELYLNYNTIKIKNLKRLQEIRIYSDGDLIDLEINGVPNLRLFKCDLFFRRIRPPNVRPFRAHSISLGDSVKELWLGTGLITDVLTLEIIKSGFPFLESLTLDMTCWTLGIFHFTCESLKTLSLMWAPRQKLINVQVYAPKLLDFIYCGYTFPSLSFPVSTLVQTTFELSLDMPLDLSFFVKMREALTLASKCALCITTNSDSWRTSDIKLGDLRTRLPFPPANNVQRLEFQAVDHFRYEHRTSFFRVFFRAFFRALFEICRPKHVFAKPDVISGQTSNQFFKLMVREIVKKKKKKKKKKMKKTSRYWPSYLKHVQIERHHYWNDLRDSHQNAFLDRPIHFKLDWC